MIPVGVSVGVGVRMLYRKHTVDQTESRICFKFVHNVCFRTAKVWLDFGIAIFKVKVTGSRYLREMHSKRTVDQSISQICFKFAHTVCFGMAKVLLDFQISMFKVKFTGSRYLRENAP